MAPARCFEVNSKRLLREGELWSMNMMTAIIAIIITMPSEGWDQRYVAYYEKMINIFSRPRQMYVCV